MKTNLCLKELLIKDWRLLFATSFADFTHELSLILLLSLTNEGILGQSGSADHEINIKQILLQ